MQILWLAFDVAVGVLLAGLVAPLALAALPDETKGPTLVLAVAVACVVGVSVFRHLVVGTPGMRQKP